VVAVTPSPLPRGRGSDLPTPAGTNRPLVTSVVVNYCGFDDTRLCIDSLLASTYERHLVVVVDNASPSADADRLSAEFGDRIHVLSSTKNLGYGGGANLGIGWALDRGSDFAWVLNNDTTVDPTCIKVLVDAMESNTDFGILSPQISAPIGREAPSGIWFSGGSVLLAKATARHSVGRLTGESIARTEYVTGCAMFIRASALAGAGLFCEPLFLFWEDVDLSLRMRRTGWELGVVPNALIHHRIHRSIVSRTSEYYYFRNALLIVRGFGSRSALVTGPCYLTYELTRRWARAFLRRRPAPTTATRGLLVGIVLAIKWPRRYRSVRKVLGDSVTPHPPEGLRE
jgi:GT2 family glycosyltransferase